MYISYNFKPLFENLKKSRDILDNAILYSNLVNIEKFANTENEKAAMLGKFVRKNSQLLNDETQAYIKKEMENNNFDSHFTQHSKPKICYDMGLKPFTYVLTIGGFLIIIAGFIQLIIGDIRVGLGTKYLVRIVKEGGTTTIIGLIFFIGGLIRLNHEKNKKRFINSLEKQIL